MRWKAPVPAWNEVKVWTRLQRLKDLRFIRKEKTPKVVWGVLFCEQLPTSIVKRIAWICEISYCSRFDTIKLENKWQRWVTYRCPLDIALRAHKVVFRLSLIIPKCFWALQCCPSDRPSQSYRTPSRIPPSPPSKHRHASGSESLQVYRNRIIEATQICTILMIAGCDRSWWLIDVFLLPFYIVKVIYKNFKCPTWSAFHAAL
jgi:hypothetical protein